MSMEWTTLLRPLGGLVAGGLIGVGFGMLQNLALRRNQQLQQAGDLKSGWTVVPGSMRRIAYLMLALIVVQVFCPLLFTDGVQWWVSGGVVAGYGAMLIRQLRLRH